MNFKKNIRFTLRFRLFIFLIILMITVLMGLIIILLTTGSITAGLKESELFIKNEHDDISKQVSKLYDNFSAEAVGFSRFISLSIESKLKEKGLNTNDIKNRPELLEGIISDEISQVLLYLNKSKSSGAFIILDATINNKLPDSENSKAGIYLKNMEPNIVNSTSPTIYVLRGSPSIAYKSSLPLHPQWKMEFKVNEAPYYYFPIANAKNNLPLSKLYYWSTAFTFPETSEELMICSVPLIDSEGNVFGVCGLDISSMLFKLSFMPDNNMYQRILCMISPISDNTLKTNNSLFSGGGYSAFNDFIDKDLNITEGKSLYTYKNEETSFIGYHELIKLYPDESVYSSNQWALSIMIPKQDVQIYIVNANLKLLVICSLVLIFGIATSFILSKYYIKPIYSAIALLKDNPSSDVKTNIMEIDELINFISAKAENLNHEKKSDSHSIILNEFLKNFKTLSPAERSVFNLYAQELTAKEIAEKLCLSINTIKTHTKHIYSKLNVKSKEELLLYVEMLKESGNEIK